MSSNGDAPFRDLPGIQVDIGHDLLHRGVPVAVTQLFSDGTVLGAQCFVPAEALSDSLMACSFAGMVEMLMGRHFRPWLYPDPCPFPEMVPFPAVARAGAAARRWAERARRR